jgi:Na+-translocating ferredoxin:NAD+ oxidoreductase RNF subunit RnfB
MTETIIWAVGSMFVLGLLFGIGLVVASRIFGVKQDPRVELILTELPGINCGSCGYSGCEAYAQAVADGEDVNLCTPGGPDCARALGEIMGVEAGEACKMRAVLHCQGGTDKCGERFQYYGTPDCRAAHVTSGGPKACEWGCLGFGACAEACPFGAITMDENRLPVVNVTKCTACGECVRACPRHLFTLLPVDRHAWLGCSNHAKGGSVKKICDVGCIACTMCVRKDPNDAIEMVNNLPVLHHDDAEYDFTVAAEVCPMDCFVVEKGARAPEPETAEETS